MKWHGKRNMLNLPGFQTTAAIATEIEDTSHKKVDSSYEACPDWTFQISNCDRSLSFELDGFRGHANAELDRRQANDLYKLDTMIEALTEFREGVAVEHRRYKLRMRRLGR